MDIRSLQKKSVQMRSHWNREASNPMTGVLVRKTQTHGAEGT